jgi:hypothetical protein
VNAAVAILGAALMVLVAMGTYALQWRLERSDYERHFED